VLSTHALNNKLGVTRRVTAGSFTPGRRSMMTWTNVSKDPEIPASHAEAEEALGMPPEHWGPRYSDEGIAELAPASGPCQSLVRPPGSEARQLRLDRDGSRRSPVHPTPLNSSPPPDISRRIRARAGRLARLHVVRFIP
jgi:hypothetical protein